MVSWRLARYHPWRRQSVHIEAMRIVDRARRVKTT